MSAISLTCEITLDENPFMFCSLWKLLQKEGHSSSMEKNNSEINNEELEEKYRRSNPLTVRRFHSFKAICLFPGSPLRNSSCLFLFERLFVLLVRSTFFSSKRYNICNSNRCQRHKNSLGHLMLKIDNK